MSKPSSVHNAQASQPIRLTMALEPGLYRDLEQLADRYAMAVSTLAREILSNYLADRRTRKRLVMEASHYTQRRPWESLL